MLSQVSSRWDKDYYATYAAVLLWDMYKAGAIVIENRVYVGINSTLVGGDDWRRCFNCPNTFVNQDVPSHSIVIGSLCKIIQKENATGEYICAR